MASSPDLFDPDHPVRDEDLPDGSAWATSGGGGDGLHQQNQQQKPLTFSPAAEPVEVYEISVNNAADRGLLQLGAVPEIYRSLFKDYPYFNLLQSKLLPVLLHSDNAVAVCAPTGSGKTALFELAMVRLLIEHNKTRAGQKFIDKIIYLSPLKAICNERRVDWEQKFAPLNIAVCELTGDSEIEDHRQAHTANLIITTPEKWDAMTRKWRDSNRTIMMQTKLMCIDEVHLLAEKNRGASLETIVSRVKIAKMLTHTSPTSSTDDASIRFVAVSASAPNVGDIARWLGTPYLPGKAFRMSQSERPVKLTQVVKGIKYNASNPYGFDRILSRPIAEAVNSLSKGKPVLIFCLTRNSTQATATDLARLVPTVPDPEMQSQREKIACELNDKTLAGLVREGFGYHHAGLHVGDKALIETAFCAGLITVLCSTSTLSQGVNLPAYMVVIKGVHKCIGKSQTDELSESELLQMTGRAGRPQFDDHGVAVIICPDSMVQKYERLLSGEKIVESTLHKSLPEHMNSEVVLKTIYNKDVAVNWLKSTFFYIRCTQNRRYYNVPTDGTEEQIQSYLQTIVNRELNGLNKYGMITMTSDGSHIEATEVGRIMTH